MSDENETRDRQPEGRRPAWRSGTPSGQERVVSYESDERYWTDYLRVALPVVGLLLMLGLLVWWANSIIGDEQGAQPTSTVASTTQIITATPNTPTATVEGGLTPTEVIGGDSTPGTNGGNGEDPTQTPAAGEDTAVPDECDSEFVNGDPVQTSEAARFRKEPNFDQAEPPTLPTGAQLEIVSDCYTATDNADGEETRFRRVITLEDAGDVGQDERGWVSEDLLEPAP